jgi:N6-adenosine-specific RNA methylase IME4
MSLDEICALPVESIAAPDGALFLWITDPMLPVAFKVIEAWGFTFKTVAFTWAKLNSGKSRDVPSRYSWITEAARPGRSSIGGCPPSTHSAKPPEIRTRIERLVGGPYAELFARDRVPGWDAWWDEI